MATTRAGMKWRVDQMDGKGHQMGFSSVHPMSVSDDEEFEGEFADGGALDRALCVYAYTTGSNFYSLTRVIVADRRATIHRVGIFNREGTLIEVEWLEEPVEVEPGTQFVFTHTCSIG